MMGKATELKKRIKILRTEQTQLSKLETLKTFEIQSLIRQQGILEDEIVIAERELEKLRVKPSKVKQPNTIERIMETFK